MSFPDGAFGPPADFNIASGGGKVNKKVSWRGGLPQARGKAEKRPGKAEISLDKMGGSIIIKEVYGSGRAMRGRRAGT